MKLSSQQINALANKIYKEVYKTKREIANEIKEQIKSDEQRLKPLIEKANDIKGLLSKYENISIYINDSGIRSFYGDATFNRILDCIITNEAEKEADEKYNSRKIKNIKSDDVRNDIIIETIECTDLEEVINKIKAKYTEE